MTTPLVLNIKDTLPDDGFTGTLVGRAWLPPTDTTPGGPAVVVLRADGVFDISDVAPTMSSLLEHDDPVATVRNAAGRWIGSLESILAGAPASVGDTGSDTKAHLLAPCDLQVIKAAGVTFAGSLIERVIEEQTKGDPAGAAQIRAKIQALVGDSLASIRPDSTEARELKALLIAQGMWSQYLEVGIGPDAEVFTKAPVLSALGTGTEIGLHPKSEWNNPEPEVVLAINSRGEVLGATLGNDVNLRDFEGRSALLLGKAKDNNGSTAIGPFLRLFDESFSIDHVRQAEIGLRVEGDDGFVLVGTSSMNQITRDPLDLVAQTIGAIHQYPDGAMLFLGTLFAPVEDRDAPGGGFTHKEGDIVRIATPSLGTLVNRVGRSDRIAPWQFGTRALINNLAQRGLLGKPL
ncbi:fumarylacetoacetate hydrolase family protein [Paraburkholderia diazotrophica]|uniref:Fumarylacetoacetate (FAA) hydrolase family protein n=1 Tax=Paraburkholderia diazotrophica TaxID=667676 RepID=A0A1H7AT44_9BURK|nr:fumarylacetoacetate hydrolase family protein [Paraburkholderia diazotrophica]SEJ68126.1 Fumarylacetoacetate (FAA) hydrolase family protein [Paraburkholderia diazotrophica]